MKKSIILLAFSIFLFANDSEYYSCGNQLVPMESVNIRLDKEILRIKKNDDGFKFDVDVEYTLFNEGEARITTIGFESVDELDATEPEYFFQEKYDDKKLLKGERRAIQYFTGKKTNENVTGFQVFSNGKSVPFEVANVSRVKSDKYTSSFLGWVYYFNVKLKKGKNIIRQSYTVHGETTVYSRYSFTYILSTAKRWKGGIIKDFTLILDMGKKSQFEVYKTFFTTLENWKVENGAAKDYKDLKINPDDLYRETEFVRFYTKSKKVIFRQKNFVPNGAVEISSLLGH